MTDIQFVFLLAQIAVPSVLILRKLERILEELKKANSRV